jgi:hypothetical protein
VGRWSRDHVRNADAKTQHLTPGCYQHSVNRFTAVGYDRNAPNQFVIYITKSDNSSRDRAPTGRLPHANHRMSPG